MQHSNQNVINQCPIFIAIINKMPMSDRRRTAVISTYYDHNHRKHADYERKKMLRLSLLYSLLP